MDIFRDSVSSVGRWFGHLGVLGVSNLDSLNLQYCLTTEEDGFKGNCDICLDGYTFGKLSALPKRRSGLARGVSHSVRLQDW
jgi:hypothetical protein